METILKKRKPRKTQMQKLEEYIDKALVLPDRRIQWPDDLFLADVRNTPFFPSVNKPKV
jgi:hypothetical protein